MDFSESYYREKEIKNIFGNGEGWFCLLSFFIILNIFNSKRERER